MNRLSRKTALIAVVALLAAGGISAGALAASGAFSAGGQRQAFLADAAGRLGVSPQQLQDALKAAAVDRVDAALAAGTITQARAQRLKAAIGAGKQTLRRLVPGLRRGVGAGTRRRALSAAAAYLGLTPAELRSRLRAGQSLAAIATAQGKSVDGLEQALLARLKARIDALLERTSTPA